MASAIAILLRLTVATLLVPALCAAESCSVCGQQLRGEFLKMGNASFCSRKCYLSTRPTCAVCGKVIAGSHLSQDNRHFCSESCFNNILPTCAICGQRLTNTFSIKGNTYCQKHVNEQRCNACGLPVGNGAKLADGRIVCAKCRPGLIFALQKAEAIYAKARATISSLTGKTMPPAPPLELVGRDELASAARRDSAATTRETGKYIRNMKITKTSNQFGMVLRVETNVTQKILILYGLTQEHFASTAAHELTHNLVAERFQDFNESAPDWACEGLSQYMAALVCQRLGYHERIKAIEKEDDEVYGAGYRWFASRFGSNNWSRVNRWLLMREYKGLPPKPAAQP